MASAWGTYSTDVGTSLADVLANWYNNLFIYLFMETGKDFILLGHML